MKPTYVVTGAAGHLGSTLVRMLLARGDRVRGLLLPGELGVEDAKAAYVVGDVRKKASLEPLFAGLDGEDTVVLHTAGIIDISKEGSHLMRQVNVEGTHTVVGLCMAHGVKRMVYVSSVHAIPEKEGGRVMDEVGMFSPQQVEGGYAKTKAEATQVVLDAAAQGLDAVVVHPSGILGPYDRDGNHLVQMVTDYLRGKLPACVRGGYDFVDVRDVAAGCLAAAERGRTGECYILSNRHYEVKEVLAMVRALAGGRRLPVLPMWMAKLAAPGFAWRARRRKGRPLFTAYSLYTLTSNDRFSHDKATWELGYRPRDLRQTLADMIAWQRGGQVAPA